jgi:5-methylcytosine-specific restriction enzyme subunit McrC
MPTVFHVREHNPLPSEAQALVFKSGRLDIFPTVLASRFLGLSLTNGRPILRTTNYVGILPLNAEVTLQIEPKVPIASIASMLAFSTQEIVVIDEDVEHEFESSPTLVEQLLEFLSQQLIRNLERIVASGLAKQYVAVEQASQSIRGTILFNQTIRKRVRNDHLSVGTKRFERTSVIPANLAIRQTLELLSAGLLSHRSKRARQIIEGINRVARHFPVTNTPQSSATLERLLATEHLRASREDYRRALRFAQALVSKTGIEVTGSAAGIPTRCFLLSLDLVFEDYVRSVLQRQLSDVKVRSAKSFPPAGERRRLLSNGSLDSEMEPDIVVCRNGVAVSIFDVKYKAAAKGIERHDLNQIVAYAVGYGVKRVGIISPASATGPQCQLLGKANDISVYQIGCDLTAVNRAEAEKHLVETVNAVLKAS